MFPSAVRLAAVSASKSGAKTGSNIGTAVIKLASIGAVGTLFIGWPLFIRSLERKNMGAGTVPIPDNKVY